MDPPKDKEKKKLVAPEDKAKQNMAKSLFGGPKGPTAKPAPTSNPTKPPEQKKKVEKIEKVQTTDLL